MSVQSDNNSLPPYDSSRGIENRNFLSPVGFKFTIERIRGVDFFCQSASIPAISMQDVNQPTRFNRMPHPGDELYYEPLFLRFLVDENMKNWYQVHDWMRNITTPVSSKEFTYDRGNLDNDNPKPIGTRDQSKQQNQWRSDCSLFILSSNYQPVAEFVFRDAFPINLSTLTFDASVQDIEYFTAECTLKYSYFDYYIYDAATATDSSMKRTYRTSGEGTTIS